MRKKMEANIDVLRNQDGHPVIVEFKAKFYKIVIEHFLCKFHFFLFALDIPNYFNHLNTAHCEDQALGLE